MLYVYVFALFIWIWTTSFYFGTESGADGNLG